MARRSDGPMEVTVEQEVQDVSARRPHVLLIGAGASKAAIPNGDRNGVSVPLLRDVAEELDLFQLFPDELIDLARTDFEAAYGCLVIGRADTVDELNRRVAKYFSSLELPDEPNLYDVLHLSLREKDAIFTFNWDPFLLQSRIRLARHGVRRFPKVFFLHGNVLAGFCRKDENSGLIGRRCSFCNQPFEPSPLLFPVEVKNYQDGGLIEREWQAVRAYLEACFMLTIFGYSAPKTDVEAVDLLKQGWGDPQRRQLEQTEIVNRPSSDHDALRETWAPFVHSHHYEIHDDFYSSWLAKHPRRSGEAYWDQYIEAAFIEDNPIPREFTSVGELIDWFEPLLEAETGDC